MWFSSGRSSSEKYNNWYFSHTIFPFETSCSAKRSSTNLGFSTSPIQTWGPGDQVV